MGVHGRCLTILQRMYEGCALCIKAPDGIGDLFGADLGVKQGDPLSPLLFGIFVDQVTSFLTRQLPDAGVRIGGMLLACILYADDLVLLAHDTHTLQQLVNALALFCSATKLNVNVAKTEFMVFDKHFLRVPNGGLRYMGHTIQQVASFVYLGVVFHAKGRKDSAKQALLRRMGKATAALFAMMGTCQALHISDTRVLCTLFDTLVLPCLLYGAELWAPEVLMGSRGGGRHLAVHGGGEATKPLPTYGPQGQAVYSHHVYAC